MKTTRYREFLSTSPSPGVRFCALESERYKTVRARVFFLEPIREFTATQNSLLARMLRMGSEKHPTRRELARACEELYGASLGVSVTRFADVQALVGTIEFPADRFLPKGAKELEGALNLLSEVLTKPALDESGSALRADVLEHEKYQLENELKSIQDEKPAYAALLATQRTYAGTPGAVYEHGRVDDLPNITGQDLHTRLKLLASNARVMAFVTGPVNQERALKALLAAWRHAGLQRPARHGLKLPAPRPLPHRARVSKGAMGARASGPQNAAETAALQTQLVFSWTGAGVYGREDFAPSLYANALFGGLSTSRLFKIVREKHGLAYAVSSGYHRARGVITAQAAVDPGKAEKAEKLIRSEFKRLVEKGFSAEEFATAKESLIEASKAAMDSLTARANDTVFQATLGFQRKPEQQLRDLAKVNPQQVKTILKRMKPHTEFRLG